ncbi:hypothetical protein C0989_003766 [Termitomyces sp. Mn162]|nr:hypothetical protein C0989_003766 [Termitomyces sp. Mn162]
MSSTLTSTLAASRYRPVLADFELLKLLGQGYSGLVYLALENVSKRPVALKVVNKGNGHDSRTLSEQEIQRSLSKSSFALPLLASWHDANNFYLVSPFCGGHDMSINLAVEGRFNEDRARFHAAELLVALEEMKAKKIIHRDIKPANIVFTAQGHIKLVDFGFATKLKESPITHYVFEVDPDACSGSFAFHDPDFTSTERVGTPSYMSPDQHLGRPYSFEADLHSLGVTIYQMLTGRFPFGDGVKSLDEIFEAVLCEHLVFRPEDKVSPEARDLLAKLLQRDSKQPAQLEDIIQHPWFAGVRWDRVRSLATSPSWKPHLSPLPKDTSICPVIEGEPCFPDPHPSFTYVSPDFTAMRTQEDGSILNRLARLFTRDQPSLPSAAPSSPSPSTSSPLPSASPSEVRTEPTQSSPPVVSPSSSTSSTSKRNPPPTPPPTIPLPPLPTAVATFSKPSSSSRSSHAQSSTARGDLPPLHIRQQLIRRAPPPSKPRPLRGDMTLMPQVFITPADDDDDAKQTLTDAPPVLRLPLGDITNQRLLSPSDAERPAFNPVLKPGPRIKLSAPPKRARRLHKENRNVDKENKPKSVDKENQPKPVDMAKSKLVDKENKRAHKEDKPVRKENKPVRKENKPVHKENESLQVQLKAKSARTPPTAVFMLPPKTVPLPLVMPTSSLSQVSNTAIVNPLPSVMPTPSPSQAPKTAVVKSKTPIQPLKSSPPKSATPKVKSFSKVTEPTAVKGTESKLDTARSSVKRRNSMAGTPASPVPTRPQVGLTNSHDVVYPRPLARAESFHHAALAFADSKDKPADYPRPPEKVVIWKPLSIEEAFAPPPASPPQPQKKKKMAPALTFTSAPQSCGVLTFSTAARSKESLTGFYGPSSPRINLDPQDLKQRNDALIERVRSSFKDAQDDPSLLARAASLPMIVGPHYAGYLPGPSPTGIISDLKRLWIRLSMVVSRAISWLRYRGEPGYTRI